MSENEKPQLVNPYELLGFDSKKPNIDLKELKKNYYNLAILCHPDKGGNKDDMIMLQNAYEYVKKQAEISKEKSRDYEETVDEFETFMEEQSKDPPPFSKIYEEAHIWLQEFNHKFGEQRKLDEDVFGYDPNQDGYGSFMDDSEYQQPRDQYKVPVQEVNYKTNFNTKSKVKHAFDWDLMDSENTGYSSLMDYGQYYDLKQKTIDNFSQKTDNGLEMTDYRMAFTSAEITNTKTVKVEKAKASEVESRLEKLKAERYVLDSELDDRVMVKSFVMVSDHEKEYIPKLEESHSSRKSRWF